MKLRKVLFISCILLSALLFVNGLQTLKNLDISRGNVAQDNSEKINVSPIIEDSSMEEAEVKQIQPKPPINILLIGLDQEEVRSDVIILLNFNPSTGKINILSVPRDTRVKVRGRFEKINALYAFGKETLLVKGIEQLSGLHINYYLTLNFIGFRKIVDTLDGIEFEVPFNMDYDDPDQNLHIHLKKGRQTLDGKKAEGLVRYRKGNKKDEGYEDGDIGRIKMQQDFIKEFFAQKLKLRYILKVDDIFFVLKRYMKTNIELSDINKYVSNLKSTSYENIDMYTVPGDSKYLDKLWYFIADKVEVKKLINEKFFVD